MVRWAAFLALWCGVAAAAWTEYRIGPLRVVSNAGDTAARERLTEMEQIRYVLGGMLGRDALRNEELNAIWPVTLVLFDSARELAPYALPEPFVEGGSANLSAAAKGREPSPAWRHEIVRQLIEANAGRMPQEIETALADLFSTIAVRATRVELGGPPAVGALPADRKRGWARLHMLATRPEYAGRLRVYLRNLQGGDPKLAARNTFNIDPAELDRRMDAYAAAGRFEAVPVNGKALNPRRDFYERRMEDAEVQQLLGELKAAGKSFPPDSARGLAALGTPDALARAAAANPHWGEPHFRMAALLADARSKIAPLEKATQLEPRKLAYWEALAEAQTAAGMFVEASRTWVRAEQAAGSEAERDRLRAARKEIEERRVDAELAAANKARDEAEATLRRVMAESEARIRAAEQAANAANRAGNAPEARQAPVPFAEVFGTRVRLTGRLTAVECIGTGLRLVILRDNGSTAHALAEASPIADGKPVFACGPVNPPRRIEVVHDGKPDAQRGIEGVVETYELR